MKAAKEKTASTQDKPELGPLRSGISLIEITIVLVILGIMTAAAAPRWADSLQRYRVANTANRVLADLKRTQLTAFRSSTAKTITFDVDHERYSIAGVTPLERPSGDYVIKLNESPYKSSLVSVWGRTGTQTLTFDGFGIPNQGGNIVVGSGDLQAIISVDAVTGTAVIQ
ncbi:prepilin-type N-terminal cleavage/methylation domain-containing protein [Novipirellula caenicola]|uniref:General secretion pathway GspH domain-containing protein n=1 Tax=Novipirellula caenicola TaxID=1536901 RepID=A0ABP9VR53_9BACT